MEFSKLSIKTIQRITPDAVSVTFNVSEQDQHFLNYRAGQYITIKHTINGEEIRRMYSLCDKPRSEKLRIAIKKVEGGKFSTYANKQLKIGDQLEVAPAMGKFTIEFRSNNKRNYVFVAVGSGITPVFGLIQAVLSEEPFSKVMLFYGNQSPDSEMFKDELNRIQLIYKDRFQIIRRYSRIENEIDKGRITPELVYQSAREVYGYYICGPEALITSTRDYLLSKGINKHQISFELFSSDTTISDTQIPIDKDGPPAEVSITIHGKTHHIKVPFGAKILDVALDSGLELPYSCKGGICASCEARVTHGEVEVVKNMILADEEIEKGHCLTCQSIPKTKEVMLTFDNV
jgi:ring-1,2-phenylacetyl-CoA epoxidase subunit PaaE